MVKFLQYFGEKFFSKNLDFRVKLFNVLAMSGIFVSISFSISSIMMGETLLNTFANMLTGIVAFILIFYGSKTGKYQFCYMVGIFAIFIVLFPVIFFTGGGYFSGMPSFFIFAVVFTISMLEGVKAIVFSLVELAIYFCVCKFAYVHQNYVNFFTSDSTKVTDIINGFVICSIALGTAMFFHFRMYNKQQRELEASREEALQLSQVKSNFLANMSHEIRTPINVIFGMNEVIYRESKSEQIKSYSKDIENAGKILLALIDNVLDMSKIESGNMDITNEKYYTRDLIKDITLMGSNRIRVLGLQFEILLDENLPSVLIGDISHIEEVILNFISNAAKYTKQGKVTVSFSMNNCEKSDEIIFVISVTDTGIGIKEEDITKIFDSFVRLDAESNFKTKGSGLGLSIAKSFAELMNGEIKVKSKFGTGSIFSFEIPQKISDETPIGKQSINLNKNEDTHSFIAPSGKILVVDDNFENLLVIKSLLKRTMIQVDTATSGAECIEFVKKNQYHVIFMDYMMPKMDGIETLQKLKAMGNFNIPVVALTANVIVGIKETLINAGFVKYMTKPIKWQELEELLMGLLPKKIVTINNEYAKNIIADDVMNKIARDAEKFGIKIFEALKYLGGDIIQYKKIAIFFTENYEVSKEEVLKYEKERDWGNLKFIVHSLKSKALSAGGINLSDTSSRLEKLLDEENSEYILTFLPLLYFEWDMVIKGIKNIEIEIEKIIPKEIELQNFDANLDELLMLIKKNVHKNAIEMIKQMIAFANTTEEIESLKKIYEKIDDIEFREAELLLIKFMEECSNGEQ